VRGGGGGGGGRRGRGVGGGPFLQREMGAATVNIKEKEFPTKQRNSRKVSTSSFHLGWTCVSGGGGKGQEVFWGLGCRKGEPQGDQMFSLAGKRIEFKVESPQGEVLFVGEKGKSTLSWGMKRSDAKKEWTGRPQTTSRAYLEITRGAIDSKEKKNGVLAKRRGRGSTRTWVSGGIFWKGKKDLEGVPFPPRQHGNL